MENKINIAEILKDCPKGMELDCTMWDNVTLRSVNINANYPIIVGYPVGEDISTINLTEYGCWNHAPNAKCVIFPKGKTFWEGFVPPREFKRGDILHIDCSEEFDKEQYEYEYIFILDRIQNGQVHSYCHYYMMHDSFHPKTAYLADDKYPIRFATEEEKQKFFNAINASGWYKWNEETKTLEKSIEKPKPKFKVGDKIVKKNSACVPILITRVSDEFYYSNTESSVRFLSISEQDNYELVPNKFDINTLVPFESRVLIRDYEENMWVPAFWGGILDKKQIRYLTTRGAYNYCIPYEGNEHLLGKTDDCDNFYKTWE